MAKTKVREILNSEDTTKEKLAYLWDYYHWHLIITVLVVFLVGFFTVDAMNRKETVFHVAVLTTEVSYQEEEALQSDLNTMLDADTETESVFVSFTPPGRSVERFMAQLAAAEYDMVLMNQENYDKYAELGAMMAYRLDGLAEDGYHQSDTASGPIGIDSNRLAVFEEYQTTEDVIVMIPENTRRRGAIEDFFETQGYAIEFLDTDE